MFYLRTSKKLHIRADGLGWRSQVEDFLRDVARARPCHFGSARESTKEILGEIAFGFRPAESSGGGVITSVGLWQLNTRGLGGPAIQSPAGRGAETRNVKKQNEAVKTALSPAPGPILPNGTPKSNPCQPDAAPAQFKATWRHIGINKSHV
jgi:hypothetical protein